MAQSGYTPILIYGSGTATNVPLAANLTSSASGTELALNYADGKLFYKDSGGVVQVLATKGAAQNSISFGSTGLTPSTATQGAVTVAGTLITSNGGTGLSSYTAGDLPYYVSGTALSKLGIGTNGQILTSSGTAPQWSTLSGVAVTTFSAGTTGFTPSSATSGAITLAGTLNVANGGTGLTSLTAGYIPFGAGTSAFGNSANLFWDNTNGRLGIGTSSPATFSAYTKLSVVNGVAVGVDASNAGRIVGSTTTGTELSYLTMGGNYNLGSTGEIALATTTAKSIIFGTNGSERMRIDSSGNVGIGTSSPVSASGYGALTVNGTTGSLVYLQNNATSAMQIATNSSGAQFAALGASIPMYFVVNSAERMRIDTSGNVGIGTSSPYANSFTLGGSKWGIFNGNIAGVATTSNQGVMLGWNASSGSGDANIVWGTYYTGTAPLTFSSSDGSALTERMRITSSGILLTNGLTSSPGQADSNSNGVGVALNTKLELRWYGTNAAIYGGSGGADDNLYYYSGLSHIWKSGTEKMRLDSSGNLLVGTTSSYGGRLNITSSSNTIYSQCTNSGQSVGVFWNSGNNTGTSAQIIQLGVGTAGFNSVGTISYNGTLTVYSTTSDKRLKENIVDSQSGLEKLAGVKIRAFDWKETGHHSDFGVIAQELYDVAPEAILKGDDNAEITETWQVDTSILVPAMIKAIQELNAKVTALEAQLGAK